MRHSVSQKLSLISLRLFLFSVSSHFMKKFPILSYFMKIKSDSVSFHQIEVQFCLISQKMNLILFHFTKKKFDFISLKLFSFSVSFHFTKKNPVLSHFMKIKSDSVSFHQKKISFCSDSDSKQN